MSAKGVIVWLEEPFETEVIRELNAQSAKFSVQRRCADLAETKACVRAGIGSVVIAQGGAPGLDQSVIDEFHEAGVFVLLVVDDPITAVSIGEDARTDASSAEFVADTLTMGIQNWMLGEEAQVFTPALVGEDADDYEGRIIAVWGTSGAPGRSTVALNLAHALALAGREVTLVDADAHAPALAFMLGFDAPESGLLEASNLRNQGELTRASLDEARIFVDERFHLLSGLTRADRWRQLRTEAIADVLRELRRLGDVVVDLSDGLSEDDPSQLTFVPTPQDVNRGILEDADALVVVARGDAVGLTRLTHTLFEAEESGFRPDLLVVNRVRSAATGGSIQRPIDAVLASVAPSTPRVVVEDCVEVDRALLSATSVFALGESKFADGIRLVASLIVGEESAPRPSRRRAKKRARRGLFGRK
ncbi:MAG: P-loop NTPase [Actinomycetaceae bacterium]|nr:P-loop NTPase [Actinomycetaceae bacterium]